MRIARACVLLVLQFSAAGLSGCRQETAEVMPVSAFIIELNGSAAKVFAEQSTTFSMSYSDPGFVLPGTINQQVIKHTHDSMSSTLIIRTGTGKVDSRVDPSQFLSPTPYLDTESQSIKNTAARFKRSRDPVQEISRFVYSRIADKKTGIPMLPASAILENGSGDCTEHSILTASLLRAAGIPARCVVGVILTGEFAGRQNVFVYHMWVEAFYGGRWVFADSTRPDDLHLNRYIAFSYHSLKTEAPLDYIAAMSSLTDMTITRVY